MAAATFAAAPKLGTGRWILAEVNGLTATRAGVFIEINADRTQFSGNTGCNSMFGKMEVKGKRIEIASIATTKRACFAATEIPEGTVLTALQAARQFKQTGDTLKFKDKRGHTVLVFKRPVMDDQPADADVQLASKKWMLETIKGRQTFAPLPPAFVNFDPKKHSAGGDTSCNVFGGNYEITGSKIEFSDMISTMRACVEDNKMSVESDMMSGLRDANKFELKNDRLLLYKDDELLLTFRGVKK